MVRTRGQWERAYRNVLKMGACACALAGCSLVTAFDREHERDAAGERPDLELHDAAPRQPSDTTTDTDADAPKDAQGEVDASGEPITIAPDAGTPQDPAAPPDASNTPHDGADAGSDAGAAQPGVRDLIDALDGARKDRTDRVCACPGAAQECARAGLSKSSCLGRGLELISGASGEGVRALLECLLPAEQAYTACVDRRVNCREVQSAMSACALEYELATARCNTMSIQGLSLQGLCSR